MVGLLDRMGSLLRGEAGWWWRHATSGQASAGTDSLGVPVSSLAGWNAAASASTATAGPSCA
jgi:hypothetical protein